MAAKGTGRVLAGTAATGPMVYVFVCRALAGVVLAASYFPARAGGRVNPVEALRANSSVTVADL